MQVPILFPPVRPLKRPRRHINYGPAPKALVEAVRKELLRLVNLKDLDANIGTISRFAHQADDLLACSKAPEAVMRDEHEVTVPGILSNAESNAETYGASLIRQVLPALTNYQKASQETPQSLVEALVTARRAGMMDVASEIEQKLLGKKLDGKRPVSSGIVTVNDFLDHKENPTAMSVPSHASCPTGLRGKDGKRKNGSVSVKVVEAHVNGRGS